MCKCCQLCLEDLYWQCFEEKYCYDESIANYDPAEDEYCRSNGYATKGAADNNNQPIMVQPARISRASSINSAKIHEEDIRREIQTANVNLPPEILQVFANSQIFHDHKPLKTPKSPQPATFSIGATKVEKTKLEQINEEDSKRLMQLLTEAPDMEDKKSLKQELRTKRAITTTPKIIETPAISEESESNENDEIDSEVVLRAKRLTTDVAKTTAMPTLSEEIWTAKPVNKHLKLDAPYFTQRPASENDIFTISSSKHLQRQTLSSVSSTSDVNRFSMTPEVPSISFAHLPKNYLDTPSIEKFKKHEPTLYEIQTAEIQKSLNDFSMPRYYGKSDMILNRSALSFDAIGVSGSNTSIASADSTSSQAKKNVERSKRLKNLRAHLPPLLIHKDKVDKVEKEK